jgi:hypothetical protein
MAWYAIRTDRSEAIAAAFNLAQVRPCRWREGVAGIYDHGDRQCRTIFVTPPLGGWTLAAGWPFAPQGKWCDCRDLSARLEVLSKEFVEAQYFFSYRIIQMHVWARAESGYLLRAFGYFADHPETRWVVGRPTREEDELGLNFPEEPSHLEPARLPDAPAEEPLRPDERSVMRVAGAWSIDPSRLDEQYCEPSLGLLGLIV